VVYIRVDRYEGVRAGGAWWDVATAEVSDVPAVREAHEKAIVEKRRQRRHIGP